MLDSIRLKKFICWRTSPDNLLCYRAMCISTISQTQLDHSTPFQGALRSTRECTLEHSFRKKQVCLLAPISPFLKKLLSTTYYTNISLLLTDQSKLFITNLCLKRSFVTVSIYVMSVSPYDLVSSKGVVPIFVPHCIPNAHDGGHIVNAQYVCWKNYLCIQYRRKGGKSYIYPLCLREERVIYIYIYLPYVYIECTNNYICFSDISWPHVYVYRDQFVEEKTHDHSVEIEYFYI